MLNVDEAITRLLAAAQPLAAIEIANPCFALNRVLAEDVIAPVAVPPADNSAMDGYAYCHADAVKASFVMGIVADRPERIEAHLRKATGCSDVIVTSGGVSVGEEDHVKAIVAKLGVIDFWKIAIKPGKPLTFGAIKGIPFVGLPGNPASVFVTALILLRPFLFKLQGAGSCIPQLVSAPALFERAAGGRREYLRARLTPEGIEILPNQSSGVLSSACRSDGLAVQAPGQAIRRGDAMQFYHYAGLF